MMKQKSFYLLLLVLSASLAYGQSNDTLCIQGKSLKIDTVITQDSSKWKILPTSERYEENTIRRDTIGALQPQIDTTYDSNTIETKYYARDKAMNVGIKGGVNMPRMAFNGYVTPINNIFDGMFEPKTKLSFAFGVFAEFKGGGNRNWISVQPELLFVKRGFNGEYVKDDNSDRYSFETDINYIETRVSILIKPFTFHNVKWNYFHLNISPYIDFISSFGTGSVFENGGEFLPDGRKEQLKVGKDGHLNRLDLGIGFGAGVKIPIKSKWLDFYLCGDIVFDFGLLDNHPIREIETGNPARYNRGTMATLGISIPIYQPRQKTTITNNINISSSRDILIDRVDLRNRITEQTTLRTDTAKYVRVDTLFITKTIVDTIRTYDTIVRQIEVNNASVERMSVNDVELLRPDPCDQDILLLLTSQFEHSSFTLTDSTKKELDRIVNLLNSQYKNYTVDIYGHTDSSGSRHYPRLNSPVFDNILLSEQRVGVIKEYLVEKGISPSRINITKGYGYLQSFRDVNGKIPPFEPNDDRNRGVKQVDRRIEIYIRCVIGNRSFYDR